MKEDIEQLVRLQELMFEIDEARRRRQSGPARLQEIEEAFEAKVAEIGAARHRHEALIEERQRLRSERENLITRLERGQQRLAQVTNQREYSAVLNELDANRTLLTTTEENIEAASAEIDELAGPAAEAEALVAAEREQTDALRAEVESMLASVDSEIAELENAREEIVANLPKPLVHRFETIARARDGLALAATTENDACSACHVRVRPQMMNLLRRGDDLVACDSCRRILYIPARRDEDAAADSGAEAPGGSAEDASSAGGEEAPKRSASGP